MKEVNMKRSRTTSTSQELLDTISRVEYAKYLSIEDSLYSLVFHDMGTPLRAIVGYGNLIRELCQKRGPNEEQLPVEKFADYLARIVEAAEQLSRVFISYRKYCVPEPDETTKVLSSPYSAVEAVRLAFPDRAISIAVESRRSLKFVFPARVLTGILLELVRNAIEHGDLSTKVLVGWTAKANSIIITVQDTNSSLVTEVPRGNTDLFGLTRAFNIDFKKSTGLLLITKIIREAGGTILFSRASQLGGFKASMLIPVRQYSINGRMYGKELHGVD